MTTSSTPILLLSQRYTPDSSALWRVAVAQGWKTERIHGYQVPEWLLDKQVAIYGEGIFVFAIAEQLAMALIEPSLDWLVKLPEIYLRREVEFKTLGDVRDLTAPKFIKPADGKLFEARVYSHGSELPSSDIYPDDTLVLVSEPVEWEVEFRCFIADRQLETLSSYSYQGELTRTDEDVWYTVESEVGSAREFCLSVLRDKQAKMPPAFVMDIGKIKNRGWAVIEANPIWASGIYGCDPSKILPLLLKACIKRDEINDLYRQWIIARSE